MRLIDADAIDTRYSDPEVVETLEEAPTIDAVPVVRAAWQSWEQDKPPFKWYSCDYCGFHALSRSNYCPNCGAKMTEV